MARKESVPAFGTFPQAATRFCIGVKRLKAHAREGAFPVYSANSHWPRLKFAEVEDWLRSTRVPVTSHASQRVREVLAREGSAG